MVRSHFNLFVSSFFTRSFYYMHKQSHKRNSVKYWHFINDQISTNTFGRRNIWMQRNDVIHFILSVSLFECSFVLSLNAISKHITPEIQQDLYSILNIFQKTNSRRHGNKGKLSKNFRRCMRIYIAFSNSFYGAKHNRTQLARAFIVDRSKKKTERDPFEANKSCIFADVIGK